MSNYMDDSGEFEEQPLDDATREQMDRLRESAEPLEDAARKLGLYLKTTDLGLAEGPAGVQPVMVMQFLIGDLAWSERVQNPEAEKTADEFAAIETELNREKFQELQDRVRGKSNEQSHDDHGDGSDLHARD